jgi:hypothetical protein
MRGGGTVDTMDKITFQQPKIKKGANSEKGYYIDLISKMTGKPHKQICGLTNHLDMKAIKDLYEMSSSFKKNPSAFFWKLLKKTRISN